MKVEFRINGVPLALSDVDVIRAAKDADAEPIRLHAVEVDGRLLPTKQVFALATGLDRLDFTTNQARTQLRRLGFRVVRMGANR